MISLQSHNQVLYHLTQLTAALTPRSTSYSAIVRKRDGHTSTNRENLCQESFEEAVKNCTELSLDNLDIHRLSVRPLTKKKIRDIFNHSNAFHRASRFTDDHNEWKVSYISGRSFDENKRNFSCSPLSTSNIFTADRFSIDRIFKKNINFHTTSRDISVRGFKTNRNAIAENERNPTLSGRFRTWIGLSKFNESKTKIMDRRDMENLKHVLSSQELTAEEKQRVKVAFAEGYIAGNDRNTPGRGFKWIKLIQQIIVSTMGLLMLISIFIIYQSGSNGGIFKLRLGSPTAIDPEDIHVTFDDVKGVDDAKQELTEIVEFLKNPEKFSALGGRLPKGILLVGAPGTGKTLLARAVAGEAHVPFFHAAGPEFDEILVGQGAKRVRELFKTAKDHAPCVIFIDEIDSVGGKRAASVLHPYANQTINQLLSEMDGFHQNEGVIVLGATNRRDDLDLALRRPGRFDVEVNVPKPNYKGRKEILELYLSKVLTKSLDIELLARKTGGFTGADIESMVNQAAVRAAVDGAEYVTMSHLDSAREKVILGPELKGMMPDLEETRITAYHEAGHALVGYYSKGSHPLNKVTIIPRNDSLGHTNFVPEKDIFHDTKSKLLARMDATLGGRAAEELIFGPEHITTGAASDLIHATRIAEAMVKNYGMSEKIGCRSETKSSEEQGSTAYSPSTIELMDSEIKRILQESYDRAKAILKAHGKEHKLLAEALLKYETLDVDDIKLIITEKKSDVVNDKMSPIMDIPANLI